MQFRTLRTCTCALGAAALTLLCGPTPAGAEDDPDVARLASGESQKTNWEPPGTHARYGHGDVLVHAPLAVVHKAVLDFGHYKELVPDKFHNVRVIGKQAGGTEVYMQVPIMHGIVTLWQVMRFQDLKPLARGWAMVEGFYVKGNLKTANAAWTMHAVNDDYTVLKFDLLLALDIPAPQSAVDEELRDAAIQAVNAIRDRAQGTPGPVPYKP